jgi:hypothetical protein
MSFNKSPTTPSASPYMRDESTIRPPAFRSSLKTSYRGERSDSPLPILKTLDVPRPTIGSASPADGIGFVHIVAGVAQAGIPVAAESIAPGLRKLSLLLRRRPARQRYL